MLLFDQNISFKVAATVRGNFPGCVHVSNARLGGASDSEIWNYARLQGLCIVSYDADFFDLQLIRGFPPKLLWLRTGNAPTTSLASFLISKEKIIKEFLNQNELGCLQIY